MADDDNYRNWNTAYKHFEKYCGGSCTFDNLTLDFCQGFLTYLLSLTTPTKGKMMASTANNNLNKLKCVLRIAYEEKRIKENIAPRLKHAKESSTKREFLTLEEVRMLAATPCEKPVIRSAALFSCLTGLRISDIIRLQWENIVKGADGGWCMHIVTKKTKTEAVLPLSDEALALCGERTEGQVFKGLTKTILPSISRTGSSLPESPSTSRSTGSGTHTRPFSLPPEQTSIPFQRCSRTAMSERHRSMPMW